VPAESCSISELNALQAELAQVVEEYRSGRATLSDLAAAQRRLVECQGALGRNDDGAAATLDDLLALQEEYAQLIEDYRNGKATLTDLLAFQRKMVQVKEAYATAPNRPARNCPQEWLDLQAEYVRLIEEYRSGRATLKDLLEFQRKLVAARGCYTTTEPRVSAFAVAGSGTAAVEAASWGLIKSSYRD
jgi:uncharacterized protein YbgA (DUF1722 family)